MSGDGSQPEQIHDHSSVKNHLGVRPVGDEIIFNIVVLFDFIEVVVDSRIQIEWNVAMIFLVAQGVPCETVAYSVYDEGVSGFVGV